MGFFGGYLVGFGLIYGDILRLCVLNVMMVGLCFEMNLLEEKCLMWSIRKGGRGCIR